MWARVTFVIFSILLVAYPGFCDEPQAPISHGLLSTFGSHGLRDISRKTEGLIVRSLKSPTPEDAQKIHDLVYKKQSELALCLKDEVGAFKLSWKISFSDTLRDLQVTSESGLNSPSAIACIKNTLALTDFQLSSDRGVVVVFEIWYRRDK